MSYTPQFTDEEHIEAFTGEDIDTGTDPTTDQVLEWIEEVEKEMIAKGFYTEALTDQYIDIPEYPDELPDDILYRGMYSTSLYSTGKTILLPHTPFISVESLHRNQHGYQQAEDWDELTEGPGTDSDFLIIQRRYKAGLRGVGLYFYNNCPMAGYRKMKINYTWGLNLPETVLRDYATCKVGLMLLYAKYTRKEPFLDMTVAGLRTKLNPFTKAHEFLIEKIEKIENEWLPCDIGVGLIP
jgi:hypothetical protein